MSTNYYATIEQETPFDSARAKTTTYHIGKFFAPDGIILNATFFASWYHWKYFLKEIAPRVQNASVRILSEYGDALPVEDFVKMVEATSPEGRRRQFDMVPEDHRAYLDQDGFTMTTGDWS